REELSVNRGMLCTNFVKRYWQGAYPVWFTTSVHRRDLASFPTRRSSDLDSPARPPGQLVQRARVRSNQQISGAGPNAEDLLVRRSEEHTSELQSPYDLVCRLLLEKKNETKHYQRICQRCRRAMLALVQGR